MSPRLARQDYRVLSIGRLSLLVRPRIMGLCALIAFVLLAIMLFSLPQGSFDVTLPDIWAAIVHPAQVTKQQDYIIRDIRLPRILMAVLSGAMLGLSGAAMQSITRNGLADPGLIGVKEGASVSVLTLIILSPASAVFWRPVVGLAGGFAAALLVVLLARDLSRTRFILIGIGVSWLFAAGLSIFLTTADIRDVQTALVWMAGSLHAAAWNTLLVAAAWGTLGTVILFATARASDAALLGNQTASGLGIRLPLLAILRFAAAVMMTSASVACVGSLGFVGLLAPHMSRFLIGGNQVGLLSGSAIIGALLVLIADTIGRLAFAPLQIPAGIVMAMAGAPFFLLLLWQRRDRL